MNISANLSSAFVASSIKSNLRVPGRLTQQGDGAVSTDASDDVEFTSGTTQRAKDSADSGNVISGIGDAKLETGYLKNAILALPALVLRSQANLSSVSQANLQTV